MFFESKSKVERIAECKEAGWRIAGNDDTLWKQAYGLFRQQFIDNDEPDESLLHDFLTGHVSANAAPQLMVPFLQDF